MFLLVELQLSYLGMVIWLQSDSSGLMLWSTHAFYVIELRQEFGFFVCMQTVTLRVFLAGLISITD